MILAGCGGFRTTPGGPRFLRQVEWAGQGVWLKADTHTHTQFSDGAHTIAEVAAQAARYGCNVLAITDHADRNLSAGTHEYIEAIKEARRQYPEMVLLAGLEWNIPPHDGNEHVAVLFPDGPAEGQILADFKDRFDDLGREEHDPTLADEALEWLSTATATGDVRPVAIYEHPGRKRQSSKQIVGDLRRWRAVNDIMVGLSGAPGHQGMEPIGSYRSRLKTVRRWDPTVANVGDAWDTLLEKGIDVWGAYAPSDFHDDSGLSDYWPGQFSETWLYAPDRTVKGALQALRAGSFFASHGHIVREVELLVEAEGLSRPAMAGESIEVPPGSQVTARLQFQTPSTDWSGQANGIDEVALIAITDEGANILKEARPLSEGPAMTVTLDVPERGLVVRARGRRNSLMFYTNPVRIVVGQPGAPPVASHSISFPIRAAAREIWKSARSAPPLISMFYVSVAAIMLVVVYKVRGSQRGDDTSPPTRSHVAPRRLHYLLLAFAFAAFVIYGSWVPFDFEPLSFAEACQRFVDAPRLKLPIEGRTDFGTNVLLTVPVSFCALAAMTCDRARRWDSILIWSPLAVLLCIVLSIVVEFGQVYCRARVCSYNDIAAQLLGTLVGVALWNVAGQKCTTWLRRFRETRASRGRWEWLLQAYFVGLVFCSLLPFDLITRPKEVYRKYGHGRIVLVPFADFSADPGACYALAADVLTYVPVGMLVTLAFTGEQRPLRSRLASVFWGLLLVSGIETCQLFVYSRFTSATQMVTGTVGVLAGVIFWHWRERTRGSDGVTGRPDHRGNRWRWAAAGLLYAGFLLAYFWSPYDWMPAAVSNRTQTFFDIPISNLFWSENFNAMTQVIRKGVLFGLLGALVENTATAWTTTVAARRGLRVALFFLACLLSVGIELGQLWLTDATPSLSDAFVYITGILFGIVVASKFAFSPAESVHSKGPTLGLSAL